MPTIAYSEKNFRPETLRVIQHAAEICETYAAQGFRLTVRQLYYQFVSRGLLANTVRNYKRLASIIADARMAGLLDWDWIEDRMRTVAELAHWQDPREIVGAVARQYRVDKWSNQPYRPVVLIEKDALAGVIEPTCEALDVAYLACRGYTSVSAMKEMGDRLLGFVNADQIPIVLHLGDHDPSGIDMTRDIRDRLQIFVGSNVELHRLALNMDQVLDHNPPPNPAKDTDARWAGYVRMYGEDSWELDALEPAFIAGLVSDAVLSLRDEDRWQEMVDREREEKRKLHLTEQHWDSVAAYVESRTSVTLQAMASVTCPGCGTPYRPRRKDQRTCGRDVCRQRLRRTRSADTS